MLNVRRSFVPCLFALILVAGCGSSESTEAEGGQANPQESSWQLNDDSAFTATIAPWPPKQGQSATIRGTASPDDGDQNFSGTVHYRIVTEENGDGQWVAMNQTSAAGAELAGFQADVTLPSAEKVWIQFKLKQETEAAPVELEDWTVALED